jgi:flagellar basal-body rod protein FlgG
MIRGLYAAAAAMAAQMTRWEVLANNLANSNTTGFKRDVVAFRSFAEMAINRIATRRIGEEEGDERVPIGTLGVGSIVDEVRTVLEEGYLVKTDNPLDLAIDGPGFFVIETPRGLRWTKNGSFALNDRGELITKEGFYVLGDTGRISIAGTGAVTVTPEGDIFVGANRVGRLRVEAPAQGAWPLKEGESAFIPTATLQPFRGQILQGYIEGSNVNPVRELVSMIEALRSYEAAQRLIQVQDQTLDRAINDVGRTR